MALELGVMLAVWELRVRERFSSMSGHTHIMPPLPFSASLTV
jgi:hypothetical protein